jgi:hypothetical protein
MFRLLWIASLHTRYFMRRYMPTNILLDLIRSRRRLKWGLPAMLVALPYLYLASLFNLLAMDDGPGWLYLLVLLSYWNAVKFVIMGPVSVVLLLRLRAHEWRVRHTEHQVLSSVI